MNDEWYNLSSGNIVEALHRIWIGRNAVGKLYRCLTWFLVNIKKYAYCEWVRSRNCVLDSEGTPYKIMIKYEQTPDILSMDDSRQLTEKNGIILVIVSFHKNRAYLLGFIFKNFRRTVALREINANYMYHVPCCWMKWHWCSGRLVWLSRAEFPNRVLTSTCDSNFKIFPYKKKHIQKNQSFECLKNFLKIRKAEKFFKENFRLWKAFSQK